ncbi:hypothetical protein [Persicirhabdus sediminis]|uniref:hypothetical protein n=1 Tax=Persicirhabdus sediminis TaxID=454144 RepID=UPI001F1983F1|nr:hypothetical protein [Persicirhabdus sediminis]
MHNSHAFLSSASHHYISTTRSVAGFGLRRSIAATAAFASCNRATLPHATLNGVKLIATPARAAMSQ